MTTTASAARRAEAWPYKMRDLCRITGMPRQAIHFYIQQGLVPPGRKTGPWATVASRTARRN